MLISRFKRRKKANVVAGKVSILANFNGAPGTLAWEQLQPAVITQPVSQYYYQYTLSNGFFNFNAGDPGKLGSMVIPGSPRTSLAATDFTFEMKVKSVVSGNNDELFRYSNQTILVNRGSNYLSLYIGSVVSEMDYMIVPNLNDGQVHHLVFEYHGDRLKFLADGALIASAVRPNSMHVNGAIDLLRSGGWGTRWAISDFKLTQGEALYKGATYVVPVGDLTL